MNDIETACHNEGNTVLNSPKLLDINKVQKSLL